MVATLGGSVSKLIRRFTGITLMLAIAACGGGDSATSGDRVAQGAQRMSALAVPVGAVAVPAIAAGGYHSLALMSDGTVWAWGQRHWGQLGNNNIYGDGPLGPVQVVDGAGTGVLTGVTAIAGGGSHSLALKSDGTVWAWGYGALGQLGNNSTADINSVPVQVVDGAGTGILTGVSAIAGGGYHSLALKSDGTVWAWGQGESGQLGNNSAASSPVPVQVLDPTGTGALTGVTAIAGGGSHSLALKSDGTVWAWGYGALGQLGNNSAADINSVPVQVVDGAGTGILTGVTAIAAGGAHSLALKSDGTVWAWGLGPPVPVQVVGVAGAGVLTGVTAIAAGEIHSLALKSDISTSFFAWGYGSSGELGNNSTAGSPVPVEVHTVGFSAIAGGGSHSLALTRDGKVWAWGNGLWGQLGQGGQFVVSNSSVPVQVVGPGGIGFLNLSSVAAPPSSCTASANPASLPVGGGAVTITASCAAGGPPTYYSWTGGFASGLTANPVSGNVLQTTTFSVVAGNAGGNLGPASVTVAVTDTPPPPADCMSQVVPWTVGSSSCSVTYAGGQSGTSTTLSDMVAPDTGTVTATCTNGLLAKTALTCVTAPPSPLISRLSPTSGSVGTSVLIQGGGFGIDPGTVTVCGLVPQQILNWEDTIVNFIVPQIVAGTPCNVRLTTADLRQVDPVVFTVLGKTSISGVITDAGGDPLKDAKLIVDGVVKMALTPQTNGQYAIASLPAGTYTITPILPGYSFTPSSRDVVLSGTSLVGINYVGAPVLPLIGGIGPKQGAQGNVVTISGTGFGLQDAAISKVKFGEVEAFVRIGDWTDRSIVATVPFIDAAVSVTVSTVGGSSNPVPFAYKAPRNLNIYPAASSTSTVGLLALSFIQHAPTSATPVGVTQEIEIENLAQTWYWVKPVSGGVSGSRLPTKPFLIGPGMKRSFGPLTFIKKGYLTFQADNSICVLVPGGGWPSPSQLPSCIADEQSRAIIWAMEMEIVWRTVFGAPLPMDLAGLIYDPLTFALAETVLKSDKAFALASDISAAVTQGDLYALAHIPGDVLDMVTMKEINDLLRQLGINPVTRSVIQWLNMTINAGVATKFAVETLIYPNTGDLTFVAK